MKKTTTITIVGAGSVSFGPAVMSDIFLEKELWGSTLRLVDLNQEALDRAKKLCDKINAELNAGMVVEAYTERRDAFPGTGFVINCTVIERNTYWKQDFEIPKKWGIRHTLGENGGPGGLFFTLRTVPMILDIVRDMEELCPEAFFLNFSNPESRIVLALGRYSKIRTVGLCHGVFMGRDMIAHILQKNRKDVVVTGAGLNHFQWMVEVRDRTTGEDLYPALREADKTFDPTYEPLTRNLFRAFGLFPSCSDDHIGEYIAYGWEGGEEGYDFADDEKHRVWQREQIEDVIKGTIAVKDFLEPSGERATDVITGILYDKNSVVESGVIYNQGAILNLDPDAAVEVPIMLNAAGVHPVSMGELPKPIARLLSTQVSVQQMAVEAAVHGSYDMALQALLIDPVVNSVKAARGLLDELWAINKPYIRKCV